MQKIISHKIENNSDYITAIIQNGKAQYTEIISPKEFEFRMWKQRMFEAGKLSFKDLKDLDNLVSDLRMEAINDHIMNSSEDL